MENKWIFIVCRVHFDASFKQMGFNCSVDGTWHFTVECIFDVTVQTFRACKHYAVKKKTKWITADGEISDSTFWEICMFAFYLRVEERINISLMFM